MSKLKLFWRKLVDHSQSNFFMNFHDPAKVVLCYVCHMVIKFPNWRNKNNFLSENTNAMLESLEEEKSSVEESRGEWLSSISFGCF